MIFATVGTHHQPFARCIRAALELAGDEELVVQHGHTPPLAAGPNVRWHQWLSPEETDQLLARARAVVTHAGIATIVGALDAGHRPLVVARRKHLGEHVDDHQLQIVSALSARGLVTPVGGELPQRVAMAPVDWPASGLKAVVRAAVFGAP